MKEFQNIYRLISKLFQNEIVKPNPNKGRFQTSHKKR